MIRKILGGSDIESTSSYAYPANRHSLATRLADARVSVLLWFAIKDSLFAIKLSRKGSTRGRAEINRLQESLSWPVTHIF